MALELRSTVSVRPVGEYDEDRLRGMFSRCSPDTIYRRFHAPYPRVPGWMIEKLVDVDHDLTESLVATAGDEVVGEAMYARPDGGPEAEVAVVVEDGWQSHGVGRLLLAELAATARARGIRALTGVVLGENRRMLGLVRAASAEVGYSVDHGAYVVRAPLRTPLRVPR